MSRLLALFLSLQSGGHGAREVVRAVDYAVDRGRIDSVEAAWRTRPTPGANARTRRLAQATLAAYRYRFGEAERTLLALRRELLGDAVAARAAFELARIKLAQGYAPGAQPWIDLAAREALALHDTLTLLDVMLVRASVLSSRDAVFALLDSVVALGGDREPHFVIAPLCRRGGVLHAMGDHRQARVLLHDGAARAKRAGLMRTEGRCRLALAVSFIGTGESDSVRVQHYEVSRLATEAGDLANLGSNLQWVATYLARLGRPGLARTNLDSAIKLGRLTGNDVINAWSAFAFADLDLQFGDAKGAYAWTLLSDSLMRARGDAGGIASLPSLYGRLAMLRGDYESVLKLTESAVAQAALSGTAVAQVGALGERSHAALRVGRVAEAVAAHNQRRDLTTRFQMRGYEPALLKGQAEIDLWTGAYARADSLFAAFGAALHRTQYALKHDVLMYRAHSKLLAGDVTAAEQLGRDAGREYVSWRASLTDADDRKRAAQSSLAFGDRYGLPRLIAELVKRGRASTALELSEQRRAQHLREMLARNSVAPSSPSADSSLSTRQLQALIPDRETAVLEYVLGIGDAPTTLIVATRDTVAAFDLGSARVLTERVARLTTRLEARQDPRQVSRELAQALIQPALPLLATSSRKLVFVPDGALNFVPYDALMLSDARYVLDEFETAIVPSLALAGRWWQQAGTVAGPQRPSLVFGDPAYARRTFSFFRAAREVPLDLPRLPASGREAQRVARWLGTADIALGGEATEARLKAAGERELRVLHLAGHAVVDDWSAERSFIALAPGSGHDGIVPAADLATLGVRANLVVLSACRTARGEVIGGEGVQGLARPFLERGTRAVVATSWSVEDRHALALTDRFYSGLASGLTVGTALHQAKRALKASGAAPSEWGAYVLLGDGLLRIAPESKNGGSPR
jgi:CHAT domain-containing protein